MLRITRAVSEVRSFAESRCGWPCRRLDGRLALGFPGDICRGLEIGWDEFEVNFCLGRYALVWDDFPGSTRAFVRSGQERTDRGLRERGAHALPDASPSPP